jgi:hypothetical protein
MQYMRNVKVTPVTSKAILDGRMSLLTADAKPAGGIKGSGSTLVLEHTTDNALMSFRFRNPGVKMLAAEDDFDLAGKKMRAGAFIIPDADLSKLEPVLKDLGLQAVSVPSAPSVKTHELTLPRIGYVHTWSRTQDEGWVRAALDYYRVPYTYFADQKLRQGNLRAQYDVIIYPHTGASLQQSLTGIPIAGPDPIPYKKSDLTPNLGALDQSDDIRGGMGLDGLAELEKFVKAGGTLITEGSTASMVAEAGMASGISVEHPAQFFARGSIIQGVISDFTSPITYGYSDRNLPVYFNQDPILSAGAGAGFGGGGVVNGGAGQNVTPNSSAVQIAPLEGNPALPPEPVLGGSGPVSNASATRGPGRGSGSGGASNNQPQPPKPRVVMQFPANAADMLLSGTLGGGEAVANHALAVDISLEKGHIVMFALRPFWRWQTQGTFFLAFNAILNWDHLDAGKSPEPRAISQEP